MLLGIRRVTTFFEPWHMGSLKVEGKKKEFKIYLPYLVFRKMFT